MLFGRTTEVDSSNEYANVAIFLNYNFALFIHILYVFINMFVSTIWLLESSFIDIDIFSFSTRYTFLL